ncbi:DDE-type integrase/transposase/recombinase [Wenzhouxiangella sp. XN201]|uniref:DDE-type integrase/transposase/recombinase n=1 Tax=Wenzhouxiangella sp. XN201 TaxID=2710755 RepID=UPI0013C9EE12|nr:DDE-type integrase/transposase/recombinase [Wenzhouxiangella sp. XN201]NEZ02800.1 DDE-type integrase/transposase/recombinase [Wenzhouxiangella sp. XN201]
MLSDTELEAYLSGLGIPEAGRQYVIKSRETAPTRQIGWGAEQSVKGQTYSRINEATRCFESREELAWIRNLEQQSEDILEYHAQPEPVACYTHDIRGRPIYGEQTPDLLVLKSDSIVVVEVKTTEDAKKLVADRPKDWVKKDDRFHFIPLESHFADLGIEFEVGLAENISRLEARNNDLLHRVRVGVTRPSERITSTLTDQLSRKTFLTLGHVREQYGQEMFEGALWLIDRGILHAALKRQSLVDDCAIIAANQEMLNFAIESVLSTHKQGFDDVDIAVLGNRKAVEHYGQKRGAENLDTRTGRRYREKIKALGASAPRAKALMPAFHKRGNRLSKVAPAVRDFLDSFISEIPSRKFPSKNKAYITYRVEARKFHAKYPPVSKKTFLKKYSTLDPVQLARSAGGRRAANQARGSTPAIKRHARAQRPFERVVMDHTPMKLFITVAESSQGVAIVKPWLTVVTDEATGCILYFIITLKQPSRRVFALVVRHIARKYGRIFEALHTDGGKDMDSVFTRQLSAEYEFTYSTSPSANSRFNGLAEGAFATLRTTFIKDYPANCVEWSGRSRSKGFKPTDKVCDDLPAIYKKLEEAVTGYNDRIVSGNMLSRTLHFKDLMQRFPMSGAPVEIDQAFLIATSVDSGDYRISDRGTIQKLNRHYSPVADNLTTGPRTREVREDCENPYLIYYLSEDRWKCATAAGYERFEGLSENARKLDAALKLEGAEARTKLNELATESQHSRLVALAEEDRARFQEKKAKGAECKKPKPACSTSADDVFRRARRVNVEHDEQED